MDDLPVGLQQLFAAQEQVERQALQEQIAQLEAEKTDKQNKANSLVIQAQNQVARLREDNPILNQQEEELKARRAAIVKELQALDAEIEQLSWFPLGWLTNLRKRRKLNAQRARLVENLDAMTAGIRTVREKWQTEKKSVLEDQTKLQSQWQALSVEASQLQARLDNLTANIDELARRNAVQSVLNELAELPPIEGPWRDRLAPLADLNRSKADYESGLRSVAELLGLLKGLGEGMDRFIRSVGTVYEEQRRYKLPLLTLNLSDAVTLFHAAWPDIQVKVKDEKYLGTHPLEFSQRVQEFVRTRLNEAAIQKMFEDMGTALNEATKAWH